MAKSRAKGEIRSVGAADTEEQVVETPATTANLSPYGWVRPREFQGPVRFETIGPFPDAEGEPIPDGKEFLAGPKVATGLWHSGMVALVQEYDPSEGVPATDGPEDVEVQLRLLELMSQRMARRNGEGKLSRDRYLKSIERLLATLEGFIGDLLTRYTHGTVPPDDPDLGKRLHEWEVLLLEGKVPKEFDRQAVEKDRDKAEGLVYYAGLLSALRSRIQDGFRWVFPAEQVLMDRREAHLRTLMLEAQGRTAEAREHQHQLDEEALEAADAYDLASSELLEALRIALSLLADVHPEHLILGARTQYRLRAMAQKDYRAAGVELFRRIMKGQGVRRLNDILRYVGKSPYETVDLDGTRFTFKKQGQTLGIVATEEDGLSDLVRRQPFKSSTLYEWRADALKLLDRDS